MAACGRADRWGVKKHPQTAQPTPTPAAEHDPLDPRPVGAPERRDGVDRRELLRKEAQARGESGPITGPIDVASMERRRGPGRRLSDFQRAAEEGELTKEQFLFIMAIETFKRANGVSFPAWTDVLEIVRLLGYRKTCAAELTIHSAEDWQEAPSAPANVRPARWNERPQRSRDAA